MPRKYPKIVSKRHIKERCMCYCLFEGKGKVTCSAVENKWSVLYTVKCTKWCTPDQNVLIPIKSIFSKLLIDFVMRYYKISFLWFWLQWGECILEFLQIMGRSVHSIWPNGRTQESLAKKVSLNQMRNPPLLCWMKTKCHAIRTKSLLAAGQYLPSIMAMKEVVVLLERTANL